MHEIKSDYLFDFIVNIFSRFLFSVWIWFWK